MGKAMKGVIRAKKRLRNSAPEIFQSGLGGFGAGPEPWCQALRDLADPRREKEIMDEPTGTRPMDKI